MRTWLMCWIGGTLILLAACAGGPGSDQPSPRPVSARAEPDSRVLGCLGGAREWELRDEIEPHAAASPSDPGHVVAAWMVRGGGGPGAIQAAVSRDGGSSWSQPVTLSFGECAGGSMGGRYASDPWVAIDAGGRIYVSAIEWASGEQGSDDHSTLAVAVSEDGGRVWTQPTVVSALVPTGATLDNTAIAASSTEGGRAYVAATRFADGQGPAGIAATTDGGRTWSPLRPAPVPGPAAPIALAPQPLVGEDPERVWLVYGHDPRGQHVALMASRDGGESWSEPVPVASWRRPRGWPTYPGTGNELEVAPDIVTAAVHRPTGELWIGHQTAAADGRAMIALHHSRDGGRTWNSHQVLEEGEVGWRPTLAVTRRGLAALTWFSPVASMKSGGPTAGSHPTAVEAAWFAADAAGDIEPLERLTVDVFDWSPRRDGGWFLGDYHGVAAGGAGAVAVYSRSTPQGIRVYGAPLRAPAPTEQR